MQIYGIERHSLVNGPGVRYVISTQGCLHNCKGCHNPDSHKIGAGYEMSVPQLVADIKRTKHLDGLTFSGGDPILQVSEVSEIVSEVKSLGLNIWLYTGYTFEELYSMTWMPKTKSIPMLSFLSGIDVLVDGPFREELSGPDIQCIYRGSYNQKLIDLPRSIRSDKLIELKLYGGYEDGSIEERRNTSIL